MAGRLARLLLPIFLLLCFLTPASAEVCKGSKVPKADLAQYDAQAVLSLADQEVALQTLSVPKTQSRRLGETRCDDPRQTT